jgi:hypothetical protein
MRAAAKHQTKVRAFVRKKTFHEPAREYYSGFAENVRECYIPRFPENEAHKKNEEDRTKSDK